MTDETDNKNRIAFVDILILDDRSVRGGVLVTDMVSRPYEFRVTSSIKPNQLQTILYGKSLYEYMYGELICLPLLRAVKETVSLAVCRNENLLVARPNLQFPLVAIQKSTKEIEKGARLTSIQTHKNFQGEQTQAEFLLNSLSQQIDIFEPFDRIRLAVTEVHKQKIN